MSLFTRKTLLITGCCHQGSPLRWALPVCKAQYSNTDIQNTVVVVVFFAFFFFFMGKIHFLNVKSIQFCDVLRL